MSRDSDRLGAATVWPEGPYEWPSHSASDAQPPEGAQARLAQPLASVLDDVGTLPWDTWSAGDRHVALRDAPPGAASAPRASDPRGVRPVSRQSAARTTALKSAPT